MDKIIYRYMIYNKLRKEFQFTNICNETEKGAIKELKNKIGHDYLKYRFIIKKVTIEESKKIKYDYKFNKLVEKIENLLPNIEKEKIIKMVEYNNRKEVN